MKRHLLILTLFVALTNSSFAQVDEFRKSYEDFRKQAQQTYEDFRIKAIKEYAEFVHQAWIEAKRLPVIPNPLDDKIEPIVIKEEDKNKPIENNPVIIEDIIDIPNPSPQPKPVAPIKEQPEPIVTYIQFSFYGTQLRVRANDRMLFKLKNLEIESIAKIWEEHFATNAYDNLIRDCLENRIRYQLSDWAYLRMLDVMCDSLVGKKTNESELLKAFLFCQSGYKMRLAIADNRLVMLYASNHKIYEKPCWQIQDQIFYADDVKSEEILICPAEFPEEQSLSLLITSDLKLAYTPSRERIIKATDADWLSVNITENENLISFYNDYPSSFLGDDFMTRWAIYANTPLNEDVKQLLYPQLLKIFKQIKTAAQKEGTDDSKMMPFFVDALCHWIQTGFVYEYDDKVWGRDRAFFADETLYYPYCDCEDRSILLTRLVRDLLGLKCALVYYPGHLATAIAIGEEVKGDYIRIEGTKYIICDPTYIGAPIGMTMPEMDNKSAKVIVL